MKNIHNELEESIKEYAARQSKFYGHVSLIPEAMMDAGIVGAGMVLDKLKEFIGTLDEKTQIKFRDVFIKPKLEIPYNPDLDND